MVIDQYQVQQSNHIEQHRTLYSNTIVHYTASYSARAKITKSHIVEDSYETIVLWARIRNNGQLWRIISQPSINRYQSPISHTTSAHSICQSPSSGRTANVPVVYYETFSCYQFSYCLTWGNFRNNGQLWRPISQFRWNRSVFNFYGKPIVLLATRIRHEFELLGLLTVY